MEAMLAMEVLEVKVVLEEMVVMEVMVVMLQDSSFLLKIMLSLKMTFLALTQMNTPSF